MFAKEETYTIRIVELNQLDLVTIHLEYADIVNLGRIVVEELLFRRAYGNHEQPEKQPQHDFLKNEQYYAEK